MIVACMLNLCFTTALFLMAICFFVFPAFFTLFVRDILEYSGLCFVPSEFLYLFCTYSYAPIFTTGISFLLSIVCMDFCTSSTFRYRQFPVYFFEHSPLPYIRFRSCMCKL